MSVVTNTCGSRPVPATGDPTKAIVSVSGWPTKKDCEEMLMKENGVFPGGIGPLWGRGVVSVAGVVPPSMSESGSNSSGSSVSPPPRSHGIGTGPGLALPAPAAGREALRGPSGADLGDDELVTARPIWIRFDAASDREPGPRDDHLLLRFAGPIVVGHHVELEELLAAWSAHPPRFRAVSVVDWVEIARVLEAVRTEPEPGHPVRFALHLQPFVPPDLVERAVTGSAVALPGHLRDEFDAPLPRIGV